MPTLLLSRSEVMQLLNPASALLELPSAFLAYSLLRNIPAQRVRSPLPSSGSAMVLVPGLVPGIPAYTVKVHAKFPAQFPAIRGVLHLHDLATGDLLAVMDSTYLTAVRTGLVSALATDILARADAGVVAIVGAGVQGEFQLRYLTRLRSIQKVFVFDTVPDKAADFAARMATELNVSGTASESLAAAVAEADIILAATWSRSPFLFPNLVRKGVHITTLGPDEPGKCEVDATLIQQSMFVCDDRELAVTMGAIGNAGLGSDLIHAELGEVIAGVRPGRTTPKQITIYGGVGLAFQDLVVAWQIYQAAKNVRSQREFNFLE